MVPPRTSHPLRTLVVRLVLIGLLAALAFAIFKEFDRQIRGLVSDQYVIFVEAIIVVLLFWLVARSLSTAITKWMAEKGNAEHAAAARLIINLAVAVLAFAAIASLFGISPEAIVLGGAAAGIIIGLAAQTVLGNVFAGILLVFADPFRPGDRVSFVSSDFPTLAPTYPHELSYPSYTGTIEDVGLVYTELRLDTGGLARLPNQLVINAMVIEPRGATLNVHRVRISFALSTDVETVEATLPDIAKAFPRRSPFDPPPRFEVADITATTWDGVFSVASPGREDHEVHDTILRLVLPRIPGSAASKRAAAPS